MSLDGRALTPTQTCPFPHLPLLCSSAAPGRPSPSHRLSTLSSEGLAAIPSPLPLYKVERRHPKKILSIPLLYNKTNWAMLDVRGVGRILNIRGRDYTGVKRSMEESPQTNYAEVMSMLRCSLYGPKKYDVRC